MTNHSFTNGAYIPSRTDLSNITENDTKHNNNCYDLNQNQICKISDDDIKKYEIKTTKNYNDNEKGNDIIYEVQSTISVLSQMLIPFTVAGIGSVFAGVVLQKVVKWSVFENIPQLEIMVPAFLGLIGNIETTLASRLSTQANLGRMDTWSGIKEIMFGNVLVVQCQSSTVGLFAAFASVVISSIQQSTRNSISFDNVIVLAVSSVVTSMIANTLLMTTISLVIIIARKFRVNPGKFNFHLFYCFGW